ncbi:Helix-turn-helix domain-containing protein [Salegentibacter agarivorans]|jgi:transcriptional regulator with XRE-family HTH domain|uniref:Helix-turn-helix domain-containing protein n=1 Tax=Salegentibacter agarivorans TaxID=345907 RepID=A0A1I2NU10_9FLAO|nr:MULTISPECIES: helix-turn-helix transcriptional regulator [Salegentibacter]APS40538.1 XRE family transcriptional regulator [Salegentibacter sp. T436]SFG05097.1 Helix-turn-helix domain-containing protein [Salegentibacter agarivorans]|tara:strand:- start:1767 stop:2087 length:321 start_codon:yes stop_codon:yes gene_type:complete
MSRNKIVLLPKNKKLLQAVGENIKLARLRRKLTMDQVSERAGISRPTLSSLEKGNPAVSLGIVLQVLLVLGLEKDILLLADDDVLGRKIQDADLTVKERAPKNTKK